MDIFLKLLPFLQSILEGAAKLLLGLFVYNKGKDAQQLEDTKETIKNVETAQKINSGIESLPDDDLTAILLNSDTPTDKKH